MADSEIQILIKAQDEATNVLKRIEGQVTQTAKNSEKANSSLSQSFTRVQGAMLNLGQIAQGVHNIFETGQRATRNLENAQDRLENATLRLKSANQDLTNSYKKLQDIEKAHLRDSLRLDQAQLNLEESTRNLKIAIARYGKDSFEARQATIDLKNAQFDLKDAQELSTQKAQELAEAQQNIKDKNDALTIATNNQERAQRGLEKATGDAKWAYVDMGVQLLAVAGNMATFASSIPAISTALGGVTSSAGLASAAIGVGGTGLVGGLTMLAGIGAISIPIYLYVHGMAEFSKAYNMLFGGQTEIDYTPSQMGMTRQLSTSPEAMALNRKKMNLPEVDLSMFKTSLDEANTEVDNMQQNVSDRVVIAQNGLAQIPISAEKEVFNVNLELDKIPKDIYTYHHIVTVYD
jgi:hypothetical protein